MVSTISCFILTRSKISTLPRQINNEFGEPLDITKADEDADFKGGGGGGGGVALGETDFVRLLKEAEELGDSEIRVQLLPRAEISTAVPPAQDGAFACLAPCCGGKRTYIEDK